MAWDNEQWLGFSDPTPASPPFQECNAGFWPDLTLTGRAFALRSDYNCCTVKFCFLNPITIQYLACSSFLWMNGMSAGVAPQRSSG